MMEEVDELLLWRAFCGGGGGGGGGTERRAINTHSLFVSLNCRVSTVSWLRTVLAIRHAHSTPRDSRRRRRRCRRVVVVVVCAFKVSLVLVLVVVIFLSKLAPLKEIKWRRVQVRVWEGEKRREGGRKRRRGAARQKWNCQKRKDTERVNEGKALAHTKERIKERKWAVVVVAVVAAWHFASGRLASSNGPRKFTLSPVVAAAAAAAAAVSCHRRAALKLQVHINKRRPTTTTTLVAAAAAADP